MASTIALRSAQGPSCRMSTTGASIDVLIGASWRRWHEHTRRRAVPDGGRHTRGYDRSARGSDSGLVTRAAFKAVRLRANPRSGGFDSHPLPPTPATAAFGGCALNGLLA